MRDGILWGCAMVVSNVALMPLDRSIYGVKVLVGGEEQRFQRPFFLEFVMFLAMSCCFLLEVPAWWARRREGQKVGGFLPAPRVLLRLLAPALCDLVGSWCSYAGALWLPGSVVEMLAGLNMVFTAGLSTCLLRKRMTRNEWAGIALALAGMLAVATAQVESPSACNQDSDAEASSSLPLTCLGFVLIACAHFCYALEFVVMEKLFGESDVSAFVSAGVMGLWGILLFLPLFALLRLTPSSPPAYAPLWHEDFGESIAALQGSGLIPRIGGLLVALVLFNAACFKATQLLSAMGRVVLRTAVSPLVWLVDLLVAQATGGRDGAAEKLTAWSSLQLVGFFFTIAGNVAYNRAAATSSSGSSGSASSSASAKRPLLEGGA